MARTDYETANLEVIDEGLANLLLLEMKLQQDLCVAQGIIQHQIRKRRILIENSDKEAIYEQYLSTQEI